MRVFFVSAISLFFFSFTLGDYDITHDMTYEFLKKYINWSVDPCDNFYDHVCPFHLKREEIPVQGFLSERFLQSLDSKVSQLEKDLPASSESFDDGWLLKNLHRQIALDSFIAARDSNVSESMEKLNVDFHAFANLMIQQLQKTNFATLQENTIKELVDFELQQKVFTPLNVISLKELSDVYSTLNQLYEKLLTVNGMSKSQALAFLTPVFRIIRDLAPDLVKMLARFKSISSQWSSKTMAVRIFNTRALLAWNSTRAIFLGSVLATLGHELTHPIVAKAEDFADRDPNVVKNRKCLTDFLQLAYREFIRDENNGKWQNFTTVDTYPDDICDWEGLQAAYIQYKTEFANNGKELPYPDLKLSNDELFFYGFASVQCDTDQSRIEGGFHSPLFLRVNGPLSLMDGFLKTFDCKPRHRMYKLRQQAPSSQCNIFGDGPM